MNHSLKTLRSEKFVFNEKMKNPEKIIRNLKQIYKKDSEIVYGAEAKVMDFQLQIFIRIEGKEMVIMG